MKVHYGELEVGGYTVGRQHRIRLFITERYNKSQTVIYFETLKTMAAEDPLRRESVNKTLTIR